MLLPRILSTALPRYCWLLGLLVLSACTARAYVPFTLPPPSNTPTVGVQSLTVIVPDSTEQAYIMVRQGLTRAGYELSFPYKKGNGQFHMVSTKAKTVAQIKGLALQVDIDPLTPDNALSLTGQHNPKDAQGHPLIGGSVITFMGKYVPVDSLGQEARNTRLWEWIHYGRPREGLPVQAMWDDMHHAVVECFPGARIGYL